MISFNELIENNITRRPKVKIIDEDMLSIFGKEVLYGEIVKWHTIKKAVEIKIVGENNRLLKGTYTFDVPYKKPDSNEEYILGLCYYNIIFECVTDKFSNFTKNNMHSAYRVNKDTIEILDNERDVYSFKYDKKIRGSKDKNFLYVGSYQVHSIYESTNNYNNIGYKSRQ